MKFVVVDGNRGVCVLNEDSIKDTVEVPKTLFYWRYDVEDGWATCGNKPVDAEKSFKEQRRQGLTAREAVCLLIANPDILKNHRIFAVCSRHGDDRVAYLWLYESEPGLFWSWADLSDAEWGSASCSSR